MDVIPIVMWGLKRTLSNLDESDMHLQNYTCSIGRFLTEFVLSETGGRLDGLFMYNACDTLRNLPEIIETGLINRGRELPWFKIHLPMAANGLAAGRTYIHDEFKALIANLEQNYNVTFTEEKFKKSCDLYNQSRRLYKALEMETRMARIDFATFSGLVQRSWFQTVEDQISSFSNALEIAANHDVKRDSAAHPVILSGILPPPDEILKTIERAGLKIAGNDLASMNRALNYSPGIKGDPGEYYADFYMNHEPCTTLLYSGDRRLDYLDALVESTEARGIIFIGEKFCEYEYLETPFIEERMKGKGIRTLLLEIAVEDDENIGPFKTRIDAFAEMLDY